MKYKDEAILKWYSDNNLLKFNKKFLNVFDYSI
jgi:hypothetical protein